MDTSATTTEQQLAPITDELLAALSAARALYDNAPCGLLALDAELRCVNINQTLLDWLGMEREDVIVFKTLEDLASTDCRVQASTHVEQLLISGRTEPLTLSLCRSNGDFLKARLTSSAVYDAEGQFLHTSTLVTDLGNVPATHTADAPQDAILRSITNRIPARLAYYDKNLICRFANAAHAQRYAKEPEEMVGSHLSEVVRPEVLPEIMPRVLATLGGQPQNFEAERASADGGLNYFEIHYLPDVQNGDVEGLFIELHDITERRRTEEFVLHANQDLEERVRERSEELFASEQRYRLMVDAIQDYCIYFVDENGTVVDWTESAQRLHGHQRSQIVGQPYETLMCSDNAGEDEVDPSQVLRLAKEHGQWESRGWRLREDGSRFWAHTVLTALRNEAGELQGLMAAAGDIDDRGFLQRRRQCAELRTDCRNVVEADLGLPDG